jgi:hypothetical protein
VEECLLILYIGGKNGETDLKKEEEFF